MNKISDDYSITRDWIKQHGQSHKYNNADILKGWINFKIKRPTKKEYAINVILLKKGVEGNNYYWEYWLRLFEDGKLIEQKPTVAEYFDMLERDEQNWHKEVIPPFSLLKEKGGYESVKLTYKGECVVIQNSELISEIENNDSPSYNEDDIPFLIDLFK